MLSNITVQSSVGITYLGGWSLGLNFCFLNDGQSWDMFEPDEQVGISSVRLFVRSNFGRIWQRPGHHVRPDDKLASTQSDNLSDQIRTLWQRTKCRADGQVIHHFDWTNFIGLDMAKACLMSVRRQQLYSEFYLNRVRMN